MKTLNDIPMLGPEATPEQHMDVIMEAFQAGWREKYMKGQDEHGGRLWRKQCLPFLLEEVLDFVSYVAVLPPQLKRVYALLGEARDLISEGNFTDEGLEDIDDRLERSMNILNIGNEEGIPEEER